MLSLSSGAVGFSAANIPSSSVTRFEYDAIADSRDGESGCTAVSRFALSTALLISVTSLSLLRAISSVSWALFRASSTILAEGSIVFRV